VLTWTIFSSPRPSPNLKLGARYYNPTTGRFTQPDPSGKEANTYNYTSCNPVNSTDPSGECSGLSAGLIGAGAAMFSEGALMAGAVGVEGAAGLAIVGPGAVLAASALALVPVAALGLGLIGCAITG
jgi:hypothetical protein